MHLSPESLHNLSKRDKLQLLELLEERDRRESQRRIWTYYPETGPLRRELYPIHMGYFEAGATYRERLMIAANRVGKTEGVGGYELTLHLTGQYPHWWAGRRFDRPIRAWAAGDTSKTVRDILQTKLLGPMGQHGTGLIPGACIKRTTSKAGVPDAVEDIYITHASGGLSQLTLKSYDQRRESFQGTEQDVVWLDEEPPLDIYTECLLRTMTVDGLVMCTFTPLSGLSETVMQFMPGGDRPADSHRYMCTATWDDVPHLTAGQKQQLWDSIPPYQRDARAKGIPQLGAGAIYPVPESEIVCQPFEIPNWWPRAYGLDVGWNRTAAVWGAYDRDSDTLYLYSEHYKGQAEPSIHADAIRSRGNWIQGAIDPASRGRAQRDGDQLLYLYRDLGLDLRTANNAVEAGLYNVLQRLSSGRLKVFSTLQNWLREFRIYRRDDKGHVVKQDDHLMDAMRYLVMTGIDIAATPPSEYDDDDRFDKRQGRSTVSGY